MRRYNRLERVYGWPWTPKMWPLKYMKNAKVQQEKLKLQKLLLHPRFLSGLNYECLDTPLIAVYYRNHTHITSVTFISCSSRSHRVVHAFVM